MADMVNISRCANSTKESADKLMGFWRTEFRDAVPELTGPKVTYQNGTPRIPFHQASQIMLQQLSVMKRVRGG